ncbi:MAG: hypothetical protein ACJ8EN_23910 [Xanthobacteraceae bacterium]
MLKVLGTMAAFAVLATLALPGSATAAERRADGLKANQPGAETEFSSRRRWHRRHVVVRPAWGPRYGYYRPYHRPYYAGYPYGSYYAGSPYGYGYGYPYSRPGISIGFGFGPRWGW